MSRIRVRSWCKTLMEKNPVSLRDIAPAGNVRAPNIAYEEVPTSQDPSISGEGQPVGSAPCDISKDSL